MVEELEELSRRRFRRMRPSLDEEAKTISRVSNHLYVANCGPAVGLSLDDIAYAFATYGEVVGVHPADETGARVIVSFTEATSAQAALKALHASPCHLLKHRVLYIQYSVLQPPSVTKVPNNDSVSVHSVASELGIPGFFLLHDFVTPAEEQELLVAVDARPWKSLLKRRVQHYGYEFLYETRNVNAKSFLGELPSFVSSILEKLSLFPNLGNAVNNSVDQLTVNEYLPGIGLSPHIDTHSAFDGFIFSLSLAGSCIMEFRKYSQGTCFLLPSASSSAERENSDHCSNVKRRSIFLPPRSMLLLSGEARYAWHHYIPHHKVDVVGGHAVRRGSRRVSFTFRKVRRGPCCCEFRQYCDSQMERAREMTSFHSFENSKY